LRNLFISERRFFSNACIFASVTFAAARLGEGDFLLAGEGDFLLAGEG
jgi:hypothetical protein